MTFLSLRSVTNDCTAQTCCCHQPSIQTATKAGEQDNHKRHNTGQKQADVDGKRAVLK